MAEYSITKDIDNIDIFTSIDKRGNVYLLELPNLEGIAFNYSVNDDLMLYWNSQQHLKERNDVSINHLFAVIDAVLNTLTIHGFNGAQGNKITSPALEQTTEFSLGNKNTLTPTYQGLFSKKRINKLDVVADVKMYDNGACLHLDMKKFHNVDRKMQKGSSASHAPSNVSKKEHEQNNINNEKETDKVEILKTMARVLQRDLNLTYDEQAKGKFDNHTEEFQPAIKTKVFLLPKVSVQKLHFPDHDYLTMHLGG